MRPVRLNIWLSRTLFILVIVCCGCSGRVVCTMSCGGGSSGQRATTTSPAEYVNGDPNPAVAQATLNLER